MPKAVVARSRASKRKAAVQDSARERVIGVIDERDATRFRLANTALIKEVTSSREKAIEVLKESGFLTDAGTVSKRYK